MSTLTSRLHLLVFAAAALLAWAAWPAAGVAGQGRERVLVVKDDFDPPIKIKAVKAKGRPVKSGEKFLADDDWFEGLAVSVTNDTDKAILSIQLDVFFLKPTRQAQEPPYAYLYRLEYGADPFWFKPGEEYETDKPPIPPGRAVEIVLSADEYDHVKASLSELGYPVGQKGIEVRISSIGFTDGTAWNCGTYYRRDPTAAPSGWREIKEPLISVRGGRADSLARMPPTKEIGEPVYLAKTNWTQPATLQSERPTCGGRNAIYTESCDPDNANVLDCRRPVATVDSNAPTRDSAVTLAPVDCTARVNNRLINCGMKRPSTVFIPCPTPSPGSTPPPSGGTGEYVCDPYCQGTLTRQPTRALIIKASAARAAFNVDPCCMMTPVLVDVAGDGFDLTDAGGGVAFDFNGDGLRGRVSWTAAGSDDSWFALDRNGNSAIDGGAELFGNATPQTTSTARRNGFLALADFDLATNGGNGDGLIDANDAVYTRLRLWRDANHNGFSEPDGLGALAASGVASVSLDYRESRRKDRHGNQFRYRSRLNGGGAGKWAYDVILLAAT